MPTFATITGTATGHDGKAITAKVFARPLTTNGLVRYGEGDGLVTVGTIQGSVYPDGSVRGDDGTLGIKIPLETTPANPWWDFRMEVAGSGGALRNIPLGKAAVVESMDLDDLLQIELTAIDTSIVEDVNAAAALVTAKAAEIDAVAATNDGIMALVAANPDSDFSVGLSATIAADVKTQAQGRYTRIDVVADHGAWTDGTHLVATTAAFNAAIARANAAAGAVEIVIPPGRYGLENGLTTPITNGHTHIVGSGTGITTLQVQSGTLFTWGVGGASVGGGGARNFSVAAFAPTNTQRVFHINGGTSQKFSDLFLDNIYQLARLGQPGAEAGAPSFCHVYGSTANMAGSVVIDAAFGGALHLDDIVVNAKQVAFPTDATTAHAAADTTFLRFGQGKWDTAHCHNVLVNRYNRGLDLDGAAATNDNIVTLVNFWFTGCVFDYCKTNGIRVRTNNGAATIRSVFFVAGWAVATDGYSVEVSATVGKILNLHFTEVVARQAGKSNWRLSGGFMSHVMLDQCMGLGGNRLAGSNTSVDQDDLVILGGGVTVRGGSFGEDGSTYTGIPFTTRYGITRSVDTANVQIVNVEADGVTGGFQVVGDTVVDRRRLITGNRRTTGGLVEYATTNAVTAPTTGAVQTHVGATIDTLYIYGGTVTSINHNATQVAIDSATLTLRPGDTWSVTYSVGPTIKRAIAP